MPVDRPTPAPLAPPAEPRRVRVLRVDACELAGILAAIDRGGHDDLKRPRDGRSAVVAVDTPSGAVVVKTIVLDTPRRRVQGWLGVTTLDRQARAALLLEEAGIASASCLAVLEGRSAGGSRVRSLVTRRVPGVTGLAVLRSGRVPRGLAEAAGRRVASLASAGLHDRDHKPSNLIVDDPEARSPVLTLIDPAGVRRRRPDAAWMLASLAIEAAGCGCGASVWTRARAVRACARAMRPAQDWRGLYASAARAVREHGDPTPKDMPTD